jgi:chromosome segregation ATPase
MNPDNYTNDNEVIELRLQLHHEKCRADNLWEVVKFERAERKRLEAEVERLTSDLQMEKENEDRLVREWQKANNEVYGLQTQVAALIDDQTRLKAEVDELKADKQQLEARLDFLENPRS